MNGTYSIYSGRLFPLVLRWCASSRLRDLFYPGPLHRNCGHTSHIRESSRHLVPPGLNQVRQQIFSDLVMP